MRYWRLAAEVAALKARLAPERPEIEVVRQVPGEPDDSLEARIAAAEANARTVIIIRAVESESGHSTRVQPCESEGSNHGP